MVGFSWVLLCVLCLGCCDFDSFCGSSGWVCRFWLFLAFGFIDLLCLLWVFGLVWYGFNLVVSVCWFPSSGFDFVLLVICWVDCLVYVFDCFPMVG